MTTSGLTCGYHWWAQWIPPPTLDKVDAAYVQRHRPDEVCILPRGHDGDHEAWGKVTAAQVPIAKRSSVDSTEGEAV